MSDVILRDTPKPYFEDAAVTIYHGDCRNILPLLNVGVDLVLTDPPYGVGGTYGPSYDDRRQGYWDWFLPVVDMMRGSGRVLAFTHRVTALQYVTGWDWVAVWYKPYGGGARVGNSPLLPHWEPIFLYGIHSLGTQTGNFMRDVTDHNPSGHGLAQNGKLGRQRWAGADALPHPTPKPESLFRELAHVLSPEGGTILDPFMGSGTTLRAAKDLGRKAIGIEIEERYCFIAAERMRQSVMSLDAGPSAPTNGESRVLL